MKTTSKPSLIVIEDLHWADEATLAFLVYLVRRIQASPALLTMTYRNDEIGTALEKFLAGLDRERLADEIELKRLTNHETAVLIRAFFDLERPPQDEFRDAIHQLTDGNPFFVEEVLKSFVSAGEIFEMGGQWGRKPLSQLRVPRTVQAAVRQRTDQLHPDAQRLLSIAAVAGQRWDFAVLQAITGFDETALTRHIKTMISAQLVIEESADAFAFRHALTRQAIYTQLLARERAALHNEIGTALAQIHAQNFDPKLNDLAHHFYEAGAWDKVMPFARRAAERAQRLDAPRAAAEQWSHLLEAAQHLGTKLPADVYRARGQAYETLGQFGAARDDFSYALNNAEATGDLRLAWQCLLDLGFLYTARDFHISQGYFDRALALARKLHDDAALGHTLNRVGNWHVNVEQPAEGERLLRESLELFEAIHDESGIAATLDLLAGALFLGGDLPAGMAHYQRAAERFRALNNRRVLSSSLVWLTHRGTVLNSMLAVAPLADCVRTGEEAIELARAIDWRAGESFAMVVLGMCCATQGNYTRALRLLQDGIAIARDINHAQGLIVGLFGLGTAYLDLLALTEAHRTLTEGFTLTKPVNIPFGDRLYSAMLSRTQLAMGDLAQAKLTLDLVIGDTPGEMPIAPTLAQRLCWMARAELLLAMDKPSEALAIANPLIASARRTAMGEIKIAPRLLILRGAGLAALGRNDDAAAALNEALQSAAFQGARPLSWRIHLTWGKLKHNQPDDAEPHFAASRQEIAELANAISDVGLRELFLHHALAVVPPAVAGPNLTPLRAAKLAHDGLTEREREVAVLVARGLSNREIADSLSISQRTVGAHVGNILAKLGFGARAQIAVWAAEKRLLG